MRLSERGSAQGLKPQVLRSGFGTTEVVPFHDEFKLTHYQKSIS